MFSVRALEREMDKNSEEVNCLDYKEYPLVDEMEFVQMENMFYLYGEKIHIFTYVSHNSSCKAYIEIYVWEYVTNSCIYKRFIICEGHRLKLEDEKEYFHYINKAMNEDTIMTSEQEMKSLYKSVSKCFPSWKYCDYSQNNLAQALSHLYFASHRSGVREILYKSQLANIAYNIEFIPGYNIIGTSPTTILDFGLPLKLLKILNQPPLLCKLYSENTIEICRKIYELYSDYINKDQISSAQWSYLEMLYRNDGIFVGKGFNRALYNKLEKQVGDEIVYKYGRFFELKDKMPEIKVRLPRPENVEEEIRSLALAYEYKIGKTYENTLIRERYKNRYYEYCDNEYVITMPQDGVDMCIEAIHQRNCLMDYIELYAAGNTTILFLRRKMNPDDSFVTIEVSNNVICQLYAKYNTLPDKKVYMFLETYSKIKGLYYDPYSLIFNSLDETEDEIDKELREYINQFEERHRFTFFSCEKIEYYQMTIFDLGIEMPN